ncbi:MAG: hypothetical protein ACKVZH_26805 [Blastocatellia bacterium]
MPIPIPTIGDYTDAYAETVSILLAQANDQQFTNKLQQLIETHLSQIKLLGGLSPANTGGANMAALLGLYQQSVQNLCRDFRGRRITDLDKAVFVLVKTQLFQIGIFGGLKIPSDWTTSQQNSVNTQGYEENDGLKRCPDGSLVPHGAGCP